MHHHQAGSASTIDTSYRHILLIAVPVMLANIAVPIQSMIDTAIVGNMGNTSLVAALGIAAQLVLLLLGSFYFLQASTSGLAAQALGKIKSEKTSIQDNQQTAYKPHNELANELALVLWRAVVIALCISVVFLVLRGSIIPLTLPFFGASASTNAATTAYLNIRFLGFPAELVNYAFFGWFAGLGMSKHLLVQQLVISGCNVLLSLIFVYGMGMQLEGVATGTVIAQYVGLGLAWFMAYKKLAAMSASAKKPALSQSTGQIGFAYQLFDITKLKQLFALNGNIFIRTLLLTASFAWITRLATQQGETFLASNVILLYILSISAFALDGIAVSAKTLVGQAYANHDTQINALPSSPFFRAIKNTAVVNFWLAVCLSALWLVLFTGFLNMMTNVASIKTTANAYKYFACFLPLVGALAYWLDGVFFGLTDGKRIRNAMIWVAILFFPSSLWLSQQFGNLGVWLAIYVLLLARAATLGLYLLVFYLPKHSD